MKKKVAVPGKIKVEAATKQAVDAMKPSHAIEIYLQPGEYYFGDRDTRIRTILGSCVAITMWHPKRMIGGMCHFMLPSRKRTPKDPLDGKYADEAMALFIRDIAAAGTNHTDYVVKIFGGGNMFPNLRDNSRKSSILEMKKNNARGVSHNNEQAALFLTRQMNLTVHATNVGGNGHRQIIFDIWTGHVWVRQNPVTPNFTVKAET